MDMNTISRANSKTLDFEVDKYRWVNIIIFALYCGVNFFVIVQFTIIANLTERYYQVDAILVDATNVTFMISYLIFFIPIGHFIEKHDLKVAAIIGTGLTAFGNFIKLFAVSPNRFYLILISQSLCGVAQVFMISLPPKISSIWFGSEEVSMACAIGVMGCQLGLALGLALPSQIVPDSVNVHELSQGFRNLFVLDNISSISIFIIVIMFFRSKPDTPPSQSEAKLHSDDNEQIRDLEAVKILVKNKDYLIILFCFGLSIGVWNAIGVLINEIYLHFFPGTEKIIGILGLTAVFGGAIFGNLLFSYVMDKTHEFKKVSIFVLTMNFVSWIVLMIALKTRSEIWTYILIPLCGIFNGSLMVIAFECATEITYPISAALSASFLNAVIYCFGIVYVIGLEILFRTLGYFLSQMILVISVGIAAATVGLVSTEYKRRNANLLAVCPKNYETIKAEPNPSGMKEILRIP